MGAWDKNMIVVSIRCLCFLSTKPFCWGVYGHEIYVWFHFEIGKTQNVRCVFATSIRPEDLNLDRKLIFNQIFEMDKLIKDLRFTLKQIKPSESSKMINEKNIVFKAIHRCN